MRSRYFQILFVFLFICTTSFTFAQNRRLYGQKEEPQKSGRLDIHAGYLAPKGTDAGMIFGGAFTSSFDEAIDFGFGLDIFQKNYAKEEEVIDPDTDAGQPDRRILTEIDYKSTAIPLYLSMRVNLPNFGIKNSRTNEMVLGYFVRASLSYQYIISEINNYKEQISEKRNFKGWGWQGGVGMYYKVGSRSTLVVETIYNNCVTNSRLSTEKDGLPQKERIDLSGVGIRAGVELELR
jgi:hypothetical protein